MAWARRIGWAIAALLLLIAAGTAAVYALSEAHITRFHSLHEFTTPIPSDAASIANGVHIAETRGCTGCHGPDFRGGIFHESPWYLGGRFVAPNIAKLARRESPAVLEAAIRQGIGHDGRALVAMPSDTFADLTDADTATVIAALRAAPVHDAPLPPAYLGWMLRWGLATGKVDTTPEYVARQPLLSHQNDPDPQIRRGEYLTMTSCAECHGPDLHGSRRPIPGAPPDIAGARGYPQPAFVHLMRAGVGMGNRDLGLMSEVAKGRFVHWTDQDVDAIYAFLKALPPKPDLPSASRGD